MHTNPLPPYLNNPNNKVVVQQDTTVHAGHVFWKFIGIGFVTSVISIGIPWYLSLT